MPTEPYRDESDAERLDRQLAELLQELRVILPGVQVLFAFLLTVPFSARFEDITDTQRGVYVVVLLSTAVATVLLMAPTALHRLRFRQHRKQEIVDLSHRLTIAGGGVLGVAVSSAVFLVMDVVYGRGAGVAAGLATLALIIVMWVIVPLSGRRPGGAPPQ
jgi:Trk-type K+ transport system membrane component